MPWSIVSYLISDSSGNVSGISGILYMCPFRPDYKGRISKVRVYRLLWFELCVFLFHTRQKVVSNVLHYCMLLNKSLYCKRLCWLIRYSAFWVWKFSVKSYGSPFYIFFLIILNFYVMIYLITFNHNYKIRMGTSHNYEMS